LSKEIIIKKVFEELLEKRNEVYQISTDHRTMEHKQEKEILKEYNKMSELERIEQLEKEIRELKGLNDNGIPIYSFSNIKFSDLENLVDIQIRIDLNKFDEFFNNNITLDDEVDFFLKNLIQKTKPLMKYYKEEDLKIHFLSPLFHKINFTSYENNFRDFYDEKMTYKTDRFIFNGETDFVIAKGLFKSEKPYFFIQEFKQGKTRRDPEPQLLAELISAIELNNEISIRGAYIVGAIWNFVILEKLAKDKYQYFVSENFDSTKIEDLKGIYRNLIFIKEEIIEIIKAENELINQ